MEEEELIKTSAYNEAGLQIQRLHNLWLNAENFALHQRYSSWFNILNAIERELYSDIQKKADKKEVEEKLSTLKRKFYTNFKLIKKTSFGLADSRSNPFPVQETLDQIHKILKQIQEGSGKGAIYKDIDDEDFE